MLTVKIMGAGCPNCKRLEAETRAARDALEPGLDYELVKVTDFEDILAYEILSTPGLVMNEQVLAAGRVPRREQIAQWALQVAGAG